jgi:hypothetical protein
VQGDVSGCSGALHDFVVLCERGVGFRIMKLTSMIERSGQKWKVWMMYANILLGGTFVWLSDYLPGNTDAELWAVLKGTGFLLFFLGLIFGIVFIRCPKCKDKWVWRAYSKIHASKAHEWTDHTACPVCSYGKSDVDTHAQE